MFYLSLGLKLTEQQGKWYWLSDTDKNTWSAFQPDVHDMDHFVDRYKI